jgi:histidyl-tRNA synthetase
VTIFDENLTSASLALANDLRRDELRVEVYPESMRRGKDLGKAFKYASARHVAFVTVLGDDEIARGEVKVKDMNTGEQVSLPPDRVAEHVRALRPHVAARPSHLETR